MADVHFYIGICKGEIEELQNELASTCDEEHAAFVEQRIKIREGELEMLQDLEKLKRIENQVKDRVDFLKDFMKNPTLPQHHESEYMRGLAAGEEIILKVEIKYLNSLIGVEEHV